MPAKSRRAYQIVVLGLLIGWFIKAPVFYFSYLNEVQYKYPVSFAIFPSLFDRPELAQAMYFLPLLSLFSLFIRGPQQILFCRISGLLWSLCSLSLMLHSSTYNDATFVVSFWVSLWLLWFSFHTDSLHYRHALSLSLGIVSIIFLGGVMGKCTREWWSGEILDGIMQVYFTHWPFSWLKNNLTFQQLRLVAMLLSWGIFVIEVIIVSGFFWRRRSLALTLLPMLMLGMIAFRTWKILSVICPLLFLLWACRQLLAESVATESDADPENCSEESAV